VSDRRDLPSALPAKGHLRFCLPWTVDKHLCIPIRLPVACAFIHTGWFPSRHACAGFAANVATITALCQDGDVVIFADELNHASLIDGCKLAAKRGASIQIYRHLDYDHLDSLLASKGTQRRRLVITDGVFSMDGDVADMSVCPS
jgi:Aminotransferase class I and II